MPLSDFLIKQAVIDFFVECYFTPAGGGANLYLHPLPRPLRLLDTRQVCVLSDGSRVPDCRDDPPASGSSDASFVEVPGSAQAISLTAALISSGPDGRDSFFFFSRAQYR